MFFSHKEVYNIVYVQSNKSIKYYVHEALSIKYKKETKYKQQPKHKVKKYNKLNLSLAMDMWYMKWPHTVCGTRTWR